MSLRNGVATPRRRTARRLLLAAAALSLLAAPASAELAGPDPDPLPVGVCTRATLVDPKPICIVIEDPTT